MEPTSGDKARRRKATVSPMEILLSDLTLRQKLSALYEGIASRSAKAGQLIVIIVLIVFLLLLMADRYVLGSELFSSAIHKFINTERRVAEAIQKISFYSYGTSVNVVSTGDIQIKKEPGLCAAIDTGTRT